MLSGDGYDERVDLWALGCCLYEMLVGQTPFAADDTNKVFRYLFFYTFCVTHYY